MASKCGVFMDFCDEFYFIDNKNINFLTSLSFTLTVKLFD
jgi:hypothetical protein